MPEGLSRGNKFPAPVLVLEIKVMRRQQTRSENPADVLPDPRPALATRKAGVTRALTFSGHSGTSPGEKT
jgi:hypothetical protein